MLPLAPACCWYLREREEAGRAELPLECLLLLLLVDALCCW